MALRRAYRAASSSCKFVCTVGALTAAALAHDQLQFLAAPGSWHLWRCRRGTAARHGHAQRWVARWAYRAQRRKAGCARQHARRCPALEPSHFDRPRSKVRPTGRSFWVVLPLQLSCHSLRPPGKRFVWAKFLAQEEAFLNEEPACQWPRGSLSNAAAASESARGPHRHPERFKAEGTAMHPTETCRQHRAARCRLHQSDSARNTHERSCTGRRRSLVLRAGA